MLPCAVSDDPNEARDLMREPIAWYAGEFPRYRRLMAEAGYAEELEDVRQAWQNGRTQEAMDLVPARLIDQIGLVGSREECQDKLQAYRRAGITLPIISPRPSGTNSKESAMAIIRACAPA